MLLTVLSWVVARGSLWFILLFQVVARVYWWVARDF